VAPALDVLDVLDVADALLAEEESAPALDVDDMLELEDERTHEAPAEQVRPWLHRKLGEHAQPSAPCAHAVPLVEVDATD
jgi:hypothetical protein